MATTDSPGWTAAELPSGSTSSVPTLLGSTLMSATSLVLSAPTTVPVTSLVCEPVPLKTTFTVFAVWPLLLTT